MRKGIFVGAWLHYAVCAFLFVHKQNIQLVSVNQEELWRTGLCYRAMIEMVSLAGRNCLEGFLSAYTPLSFPPEMDDFPIHLDKDQNPRDVKPKDAASVPSGDMQKRNILWFTF